MEIEEIKKIIDEANKITGCNYTEEDYCEETFIDLIEQLNYCYDYLLDENNKSKQYYEDNYRPLSNGELYEVYDKDFI